MTKSTFEEQIEKNGRLIYTNVGDSMWPLIRQGKDLLVIEPVHGRLRKYDVPLYKRDSGQYVLHRILEVRRDDYVICGDNRSRKEYGITDRHIIGVLTGIVRSGKTVSVKNKWYRLYVHIWCDFFPLRSLIIRVYGKLKRILRKKKR
jgi:hypothetical protein